MPSPVGAPGRPRDVPLQAEEREAGVTQAEAQLHAARAQAERAALRGAAAIPSPMEPPSRPLTKDFSTIAEGDEEKHAQVHSPVRFVASRRVSERMLRGSGPPSPTRTSSRRGSTPSPTHNRPRRNSSSASTDGERRTSGSSTGGLGGVRSRLVRFTSSTLFSKHKRSDD